MKVQIAVTISFLFTTTFGHEVSLAQSQGPGETAEVFVADGRGACPGASFYSIQDAVNAARSGDTIRICKGEYAEQVVVRKPVKLVADIGAVLAPQHMAENALSLSTGEPLAAAILVSDVEGVDITGFTMDARNNALDGCAPRLIGILYQNASGDVASNSVVHVKLQSVHATCLSGNAIEIQSGRGGHSKVDVHDNTIHDYQMNAITAIGEGTYVGIDENEITTGDPLERISWNAIQVAFGARGIIENNTVAADLSPDSSPSRCASNKVGVSVFESEGVFVLSNSIQSTQTGIFVAGNRAKITGNNFHGCSPARAIALLGSENEVSYNELPPSSEATIFILGENNRIQRNQVSGGLLGIIKVADCQENLISDELFRTVYLPFRELCSGVVPEAPPSR